MLMDLKPIKIRKMNKKGSVIDPIIWVIISFIIVIWLAILVFIFVKVSDIFQGIKNTDSRVDIEGAVDSTFGQVTPQIEINLKWISYAIIIAMILNIFIHNYFIKASPIFFFLYILITLVAVVVAVILSNSYENLLTQSGDLGTTLQSFTGSTFILLYFPIFVIIIGLGGFIFLVIGYIRNSGNETTFDGGDSVLV